MLWLRRCLTMALVAVVAAACTSDDPIAPGALRPSALVYAILDPDLLQQQMVVTRTRVGGVDSSAAGVPAADAICDARVVIRDQAGDSAVAFSPTVDSSGRCRPDDPQAGVYAFVNPAATGLTCPTVPGTCLTIVRGATYRLRVETRLGVLEGTTRVPDAKVRIVGLPAEYQYLFFELPQSLDFQVGSDVPGTTYRTVFDRDDRVDVLTSTPPRITVDGHAITVRGLPARGDGFVGATTIFNPCDVPRGESVAFGDVKVLAVDPNYRAYRLAERDRDALDDRLTATGVTGGRGVFGAVQRLADISLDSRVDESITPLGRWLPIDDSGIELPSLCFFEHTDAGGLRYFGGVAEATATRPTTGVVGTLPVNGGGDAVSLAIPARSAGAPVRLELGGAVIGNQLQLRVSAPSSLENRLVVYRRVPIYQPAAARSSGRDR